MSVTAQTTVSKRNSAVVRAPHEGEAVWFLDNLLTVKMARSDGAPFGLLENSMPAGSHTPFHAHDREDEAFYVLEGVLTIHLEDRRVTATPGTYVHIPAGTGHGFRTETPVRMLVICGGEEGFIEMVRDAGIPAERRELPTTPSKDRDRLERACRRYGIRLLGPLPE